MGLTPTGGIISGSRTGDIDPGVVIFILKKIAETTPDATAAADKLETVFSKKSGLLGVSGLSNDMRDLRDAIKGGNEKARLAVGQIHVDHRQVDRLPMLPNSAVSICWFSPAASGKMILPLALKSAPAWLLWALLWIPKRTMFAEKRSFRLMILACWFA